MIFNLLIICRDQRISSFFADNFSDANSTLADKVGKLT